MLIVSLVVAVINRSRLLRRDDVFGTTAWGFASVYGHLEARVTVFGLGQV